MVLGFYLAGSCLANLISGLKKDTKEDLWSRKYRIQQRMVHVSNNLKNMGVIDRMVYYSWPRKGIELKLCLGQCDKMQVSHSRQSQIRLNQKLQCNLYVEMLHGQIGWWLGQYDLLSYRNETEHRRRLCFNQSNLVKFPLSNWNQIQLEQTFVFETATWTN